MGCSISAVVLYLMQTYAKSLRKGAFICRYIALSKVRFITNTLKFIKKRVQQIIFICCTRLNVLYQLVIVGA